MQPRFSVPWNGDVELGKRLLRLAPRERERVAEIYFAPPGHICPSGRTTLAVVSDPAKQIAKFLTPLLDAGIGGNLLLNATAFGPEPFSEYEERVVDFLSLVPATHATVVDWRMASVVKRNFPDIKVVTSVNCGVNSVLKASYYQRLGADELTIDRDINLNLPLLKEIRDRCDLPLRLMVNEGCLQACPLKPTHDACIGMGTHHGCPIGHIPNPEEDPYLTPFQSPVVRPEDLRRYRGLVDQFKITDRAKPTDEIMGLLRAYLEERYEGNYLALGNIRYWPSDTTYIPNEAIPDKLFDMVSTCNHDCEECMYCPKIFSNLRISPPTEACSLASVGTSS